MAHLFRDASPHYRRLLCPSAHTFVGDFKGDAHINFSVPDTFAEQLVGEYFEMFSRSVEACVDLLSRPLFREIANMGERLTIGTDISGVVPVEYQLSLNSDVPTDQIEHLGELFLVHARRVLDGGTVRRCLEDRFEYNHITKHTVWRSGNDAFLEFEVRLPYEMNMTRWRAFTERIQAYAHYRVSEAEGIYWSVGEHANRLGVGTASLFGKINNVSDDEAYAELTALLDRITNTFHQ